MYSNRDNEPLVSVVVVTFNSAPTVIETLESIKAQTYENIELIITDDKSPDNTVQVCAEWLEENKNRFVYSEIVIAEENTGVSGNVNRGIMASKGEWVKGIAGDDILIETCIENNVNYMMAHPSVNFLFSRMRVFGDAERLAKIQKRFKYGFFCLSTRQQYLRLLRENTIPAPTSFMRKSAISDLGYFDERIPLIEDYPFWLKALYNNYSFDFLNIETVLYRVGNSLTTSHSYSENFERNRLLEKEMVNFYKSKENLLYRMYSSVHEKLERNWSFQLYFLQALNPYCWYYKYIFFKERVYGRRFPYRIVQCF